MFTEFFLAVVLTTKAKENHNKLFNCQKKKKPNVNHFFFFNFVLHHLTIERCNDHKSLKPSGKEKEREMAFEATKQQNSIERIHFLFSKEMAINFKISEY